MQAEDTVRGGRPAEPVVADVPQRALAVAAVARGGDVDKELVDYYDVSGEFRFNSRFNFGCPKPRKPAAQSTKKAPT